MACNATIEPPAIVQPRVFVRAPGPEGAAPGSPASAFRRQVAQQPETGVEWLDGSFVEAEVATEVLDEIERHGLGSICARSFPILKRSVEIPFTLESDGSHVKMATLWASTDNAEHDRCLTRLLSAFVFPVQGAPMRVKGRLVVPAL